jgi:hypothetical protein
MTWPTKPWFAYWVCCAAFGAVAGPQIDGWPATLAAVTFVPLVYTVGYVAGYGSGKSAPRSEVTDELA